MASATSITLNDVKRAHGAIREHINLSPCSVSACLSARSDCKLHLKMENLQRTGAYKDRGAMNAALGLPQPFKFE
jgi:threonine dehydratase